MESQFKPITYFLPLFYILFPLLVIRASVFTENGPLYEKIIAACYIISLYLFARAARSQFVKLKIDGRNFTGIKFMGLGKSTTYDVDDFDGFRTIWKQEGRSNDRVYEALQLVVGGKNEIEISDKFYKNYWELKQQIESTNMPELAAE